MWGERVIFRLKVDVSAAKPDYQLEDSRSISSSTSPSRACFSWAASCFKTDMAHTRQSRPDSSLKLQAKKSKPFQAVGSGLGEAIWGDRVVVRPKVDEFVTKNQIVNFK